MKTSDEIKKDVETCLNFPPHAACNLCQLFDECGGNAEHIIKELYDLVLRLESRLAQVERERDALMYDYPIGIECHTCKHETTDCYAFPCNDCVEASRNAHHLMWEWRGVCEENTKDD